MVVKKLYFIEEDDKLTPFNSLSDAIENFDNFMDFVIEKKEIQSLTKNDDEEEGKQWQVGSASLDEIAQAFKDREK